MGRPEWKELETDVIDAADMLLSASIEGRVCCRHVGLKMMRPPTGKAIYRAKKLLGISLLRPGELGERNWLLNAGWEQRLERVGVHPATLAVVNWDQWQTQLLRFDHDDLQKKERKEQAKLHAQKEIHLATNQPAKQKPAAKKRSSEQEEEDPTSYGAMLREHHNRRDIIKMNGW